MSTVSASSRSKPASLDPQSSDQARLKQKKNNAVPKTSSRQSSTQISSQQLAPSSQDLTPSKTSVLRPRRDIRLLIIGLLCACLGALGVTWVFLEANTTSEVLIAASPIAKGQIINDSDLAVTTIGTAPDSAIISASQRADLVGKSALVEIQQNQIIAPGSIGNPIIETGYTQVGLKLSAGRLPFTQLASGSSVTLVAVSTTSSTPADPEAVFAAKITTAPLQMSDGQTWLVDVSVESGQAAQIANLAALDQIALVREADKR